VKQIVITSESATAIEPAKVFLILRFLLADRNELGSVIFAPMLRIITWLQTIASGNCWT
jgi:hypothetical protein